MQTTNPVSQGLHMISPSHCTEMVRIEGGQKSETLDLPKDYKPTALDVCSGRGRSHWKHEGNIAFRAIIQENVHRYKNSATKVEKSWVVDCVAEELRAKGYKLIKKDGKHGTWSVSMASEVREKVNHGLRALCRELSKSQFDRHLEQQVKELPPCLNKKRKAAAATIENIEHLTSSRGRKSVRRSTVQSSGRSTLKLQKPSPFTGEKVQCYGAPSMARPTTLRTCNKLESAQDVDFKFFECRRSSARTRRNPCRMSLAVTPAERRSTLKILADKIHDPLIRLSNASISSLGSFSLAATPTARRSTLKLLGSFSSCESSLWSICASDLSSSS